MKAPATIFLDIDGTLLNHLGKLSEVVKNHETQYLLDNVIEKLDKWESQGFHIILTTGRAESLRGITEKTLLKHGIFFDKLIMGLGGGPRYLINDKKPNGRLTAFAINVDRNKGLSNVNIGDV